MKNYIYKQQMMFTSMVLALAFLFACCTDRFPSSYILELPQMPSAWVSLLGEPHWRVEWVSPGGQKQIEDFPPGSLSGLEIEIPVTWPNPVTAWPYWPAFSLLPKIFKPAGALFPFDVSDDRLLLSWEAGPDTVFYWELVNAVSAIGYNKGDSRIPINFDWPRFRELFEAEALDEAVCEDPWLVNWRTLAERTIESNFDRRRIVPEEIELKHFPVPVGLWYGVSPFAKPLFLANGEQPVFPVHSGFNVWVSAEGILRVNGNTWIFNKN
jgi:hypothetical protein